MTDTKTVRVRIAVAVDLDGVWQAESASWRSDDEAMEGAAEGMEHGSARYWLTAELPIPTVSEVSADVEAGDE
jgi:hypothetical protein